MCLKLYLTTNLNMYVDMSLVLHLNVYSEQTCGYVFEDVFEIVFWFIFDNVFEHVYGQACE